MNPSPHLHSQLCHLLLCPRLRRRLPRPHVRRRLNLRLGRVGIGLGLVAGGGFLQVPAQHVPARHLAGMQHLSPALRCAVRSPVMAALAVLFAFAFACDVCTAAVDASDARG